MYEILKGYVLILTLTGFSFHIGSRVATENKLELWFVCLFTFDGMFNMKCIILNCERKFTKLIKLPIDPIGKEEWRQVTEPFRGQIISLEKICDKFEDKFMRICQNHFIKDLQMFIELPCLMLDTRFPERRTYCRVRYKFRLTSPNHFLTVLINYYYRHIWQTSSILHQQSLCSDFGRVSWRKSHRSKFSIERTSTRKSGSDPMLRFTKSYSR